MIPSFLLQKEPILAESKPVKNNLSFIDTTVKNVSSFILSSISLQYSSQSKGLLQMIDSRIKVLFLISYIILINLTHTLSIQLFFTGLLILLYIFSKLNLIKIGKKILFLGFFFGLLVFMPASLNIFTKGETLFTLIRFSSQQTWWIYTIPEEISITKEGVLLVINLTLKVINSVSLVLLVISTSTFERIIKALSFYRIPNLFLLTLTLTYKFTFILSQTIEDTYLALKMRWWDRGNTDDAEKRVADRIGFLFRKSWEKYELTYQAMAARGYTGSANFNYFSPFKRIDYLFISIITLFLALFIFLNIYYA